MGRQQRLREHVVEREHAHEGDHDRLVDGPAHALGASGRGHPLVGADDRHDGADDQEEQHDVVRDRQEPLDQPLPPGEPGVQGGADRHR